MYYARDFDPKHVIVKDTQQCVLDHDPKKSSCVVDWTFTNNYSYLFRINNIYYNQLEIKKEIVLKWNIYFTKEK